MNRLNRCQLSAIEIAEMLKEHNLPHNFSNRQSFKRGYEAAKAESPWITIHSEADFPEIGEEVLFWTYNNECHKGCVDIEQEEDKSWSKYWCSPELDYMLADVTHYVPIPTRPEQEE